jgi:hypothetical protein
MKTLFLLLFTGLACVTTAQTSGGISAPASCTVTLTADEAAFTINVAATLDSTEAQVKQALQNAGLPNPTVVASGLGQDNSIYPPGAAQIRYSATVTIAAGSAIDAAKRLETLRTHLPAPLAGLQYSVALNPSQATVDAARLVAMPQLLDESRQLAQSLAAAAGVKVGAIRSIGDSAGAVGGVAIPTASERNGDFSAIMPYPSAYSVLYWLPSSTQYTFYVNVIFATVQ